MNGKYLTWMIYSIFCKFCKATNFLFKNKNPLYSFTKLFHLFSNFSQVFPFLLSIYLNLKKFLFKKLFHSLIINIFTIISIQIVFKNKIKIKKQIVVYFFQIKNKYLAK